MTIRVRLPKWLDYYLTKKLKNYYDGYGMELNEKGKLLYIEHFYDFGKHHIITWHKG